VGDLYTWTSGSSAAAGAAIAIQAISAGTTVITIADKLRSIDDPPIATA
jgi:hypothetical protein